MASNINTAARRTFMENLRYYMQIRQISQADIVLQLGVTASTVSDWYNGKKYPRVEAMQRIADLLGVPISVLQSDNAKLLPNAYQVERISQIPIVGTVRAGYGGIAYEDIEGYEVMADVKNPDEYFLLRVSGASMEPQIMQGDLVMVHKQEDVESGDIAVCLIDGEEATVKKLIKQGSAIVLQAINPAVPPRVLTGEELRSFVIVGKVTSLVRQF